MRTVTAIMALAIGFLIVSGISFATTYHVSSNQELNAALSNAADGDTVLVEPGNYHPYILFDTCITVKGTTGIPEDVYMNVQVGFGFPVSSGTGAPVRLEGIHFYGFDSPFPLLRGSNLAIEIRNCNIRRFVPAFDLSGGAIRAEDSIILLEDTVFESNIGAAGNGGVFHLTGCQVTARDCTFTSNMSNFSGGVFFMTEGSLDIARCSFSPNYGIEGGSVLDLIGVSGTIDACSFTDNGSGWLGTGALRMLNCQDLTISDSTIRDNHSQNTSYAGMEILGSSAITLENCDVLSNKAEPPADGYLAPDSSVVFRCCELDPAQWLFEGTFVIDNEDCPVATEQHSFGSIKAMFR